MHNQTHRKREMRVERCAPRSEMAAPPKRYVINTPEVRRLNHEWHVQLSLQLLKPRRKSMVERENKGLK